MDTTNPWVVFVGFTDYVLARFWVVSSPQTRACLQWVFVFFSELNPIECRIHAGGSYTIPELYFSSLFVLKFYYGLGADLGALILSGSCLPRTTGAVSLT